MRVVFYFQHFTVAFGLVASNVKFYQKAYKGHWQSIENDFAIYLGSFIYIYLLSLPQ